ncbi:MAG: membrane protein insertase YidC [Pseudomonadota bacterium]
MEQQRLFLWVSLAFVLLLIWQEWAKDYRQPPPPPASADAQLAAPVDPDAGALPTAPTASDDGGLPSAPAPTPGSAFVPTVSPAADAGTRVRIETDVLELDVGSTGANLRRAVLTAYRVSASNPAPVTLLDDASVAEFYVMNSGVRGVGDAPQPTHREPFASTRTEYVLDNGGDELRVPFSWSSGDLSATKTYVLRRGSYEVDIETTLTNNSNEVWRGSPYLQLRRHQQQQKRSFTDVESFSYRGSVVFDGTKYEKLKAKPLRRDGFGATATGGWFASIQHHFLGAIVPPADQPMRFEASINDTNIVTLSAISNQLYEVAPGQTVTFEQSLFIGPKLQDQLREVSAKLPLAVDYGFFKIFAQPLFWVLDKIHSLIGNWGFSIILLTILIKGAFYKLSEQAGFSMAKMRKVTPRLQQLQERYKDDRMQLNQKMMELYKKEKVNPAAGCLPLLVQMPVFIALYWVLLESVELRQAPFMLWLQDLSARDPYFVLPLLMGVSMFVQQKMNPPPTDPVQARVFQLLPIVFTFFFAFFPSGLVLYWLVNNVLTAAQQWRINKVVERASS